MDTRSSQRQPQRQTALHKCRPSRTISTITNTTNSSNFSNSSLLTAMIEHRSFPPTHPTSSWSPCPLIAFHSNSSSRSSTSNRSCCSSSANFNSIKMPTWVWVSLSTSNNTSLPYLLHLFLPRCHRLCFFPRSHNSPHHPIPTLLRDLQALWATSRRSRAKPIDLSSRTRFRRSIKTQSS